MNYSSYKRGVRNVFLVLIHNARYLVVRSVRHILARNVHHDLVRNIRSVTDDDCAIVGLSQPRLGREGREG